MDEKRNGAGAAAKESSLYAQLSAYCGSDHYPYHMPGHKRSRAAGGMAQYYGIDITEIDGFDNLHHAEGILQKAQQRANRLYGEEGTETFFLVNGSTCGVLASVMTALRRGGEILIARNCHKSVYHAAILQELRIHYYEPPVLEAYGICGGVDAEEIERLLGSYPDCGAVVITSPTYEGILSDVQAVADAVHARHKILIVDEAHGAHLGLHESVPPGALSQGADLVIHSLHKTLPAMTQTALLHVQGERVDRGRLRRYLSMLQSSSPSYVLMASMDCCIRYVEAHGAERFAFMKRQYLSFCKKVAGCRHLEIGNAANAGQMSHIAGWDMGKLLICVKNGVLNGQQLYDLLREEYHLQMEMAAERYVLAIMTIMDTEEGWQRLAAALLEIDDRIETGVVTITARRTETGVTAAHIPENRTEQTVQKKKESEAEEAGQTAAEAYLGRREEVPLDGAAGRVAADFINLYPPGIPLIVPGEVVSEALTEEIRRYMCAGLHLQGVTAEGKIAVTPDRCR